MKKHLTNAVYGALDYASYPIGMLIVSPVVLHKLGAAEYGLWMVSTAVVSAGGMIAAGFTDAGMQRIAALHTANRRASIGQMVRSLFAVSLTLGCLLAAIVWIVAPFAAARIAVSAVVSLRECLVCIRIAAVMIVLRAIEVVPVATQRAFQDYRGTVQVSIAVRLATLAFAAAAPLLAIHTEGIMMASALFFAIGIAMQFRLLHKLIGPFSLSPQDRGEEMRTLLASGVFVWLQTVGSVLFRQIDRILLGVSLGAISVAPYAVCIQITEPLFGLTASGLSFFFPYLSGRAGMLSLAATRRTVLRASACNVLMVSAGAALLFGFGHRFLLAWAGAAIATQAASILPLILLGSAFSGFSVTGVYAMQALGQFRTVAFISLGSRTMLLFLMLYLLHHRGVQGLALSRLAYGAASLLVYVPLLHRLSSFRKETGAPATSTLSARLQEGVQS